MTNFYQEASRWLEAQGYTYLGDEGGLLFYKDKDGRVWGSSEASVRAAMDTEGKR